jgi:hypothetical protein
MLKIFKPIWRLARDLRVWTTTRDAEALDGVAHLSKVH